MRFKVWYFIFSLLMILPGLYYFLTSGIRLGIDFTGGALLEYQFGKSIEPNLLKQELTKEGVEVLSISTSGNIYSIRTKSLDQLVQLSEKNWSKKLWLL